MGILVEHFVSGFFFLCFLLLVCPRVFKLWVVLNGHIFLCFLFFLSEKHKAEIKDQKVLEILQSKDDTIQELEKVQYRVM